MELPIDRRKYDPESVKFILFLQPALKIELVVDYFNSSIFSIPSLEVILNRISAKMLAYNKVLEQERIAEQKAYEDKVRRGVPFVGMSENDIWNTSLGSPSPDVRHNYECINGKQYEANLYDFKKDGKTIYTKQIQ